MAGRDPVLVLLPFVERGNPKTATKAGFLTLLTVDTEEGRGAAAGFAFSAAAGDGVGASTANTDAVGRWTVHGQRDGRAVEVASAPVSPADGVSTEVNLGCTLCTVIAGGLCEAGVTSTSSSACIAICLPLAATLTGAAFCAAACSVIVNAIGVVGCAAGATEICEYAGAC
jgi:halocin C8-like bacteriocin domain-containing protein